MEISRCEQFHSTGFSLNFAQYITLSLLNNFLINFRDISFVDKFQRALYTQIKILTLQDRTLRKREGSPLLSKACKRECPQIVFFFLLLGLAA